MNVNPGTLIVLIFSVLFGVAGAYTVRQHLKPKAIVVADVNEPAAAPDIVYVPMSSNELPANRPLTLSDIAIYKFTPEQLKKRDLPNAFMANPDQIVGRILRDPLEKGQVFQAEGFLPEGMMNSVAERLQPGYRAVTIPVEGPGALDGLVDSSSHVDVMFRTTPEPGTPQRTVTLVEDVEVLAVDRNTVPGVINPAQNGTVTLAVDARQAHALKVAEGRGEFSLTLRADNDDLQNVGAGPDTLESLLQLPRTRFKAEVFRGSNREEVLLRVDPRDEQPKTFKTTQTTSPSTPNSSFVSASNGK